MTKKTSILFAAELLAVAQMVHAQSILNTNLIVNGNAESGPAGTTTTTTTSIPGWTVSGGEPNVLPYGLTGFLLLTDPAPPDHGFQYFVSTSVAASTYVQTINVASGASVIGGGNVKYTLSAYLGNNAGSGANAQVTAAFQNASGQTFSTATLDVTLSEDGLLLQQTIGLVPTGTVQIQVTMSLQEYSAADSLSLVLTTLGTVPGSVLGTNLVANPGAEQGPNAPPGTQALYIPGWSTDGASGTNAGSVCPYGGTGWISTTDPGPADRGVNAFCGFGGTTMYQDIDVSPAASLIDSGQVTYDVSAWLGGLSSDDYPTLTYAFFDWSGKQLAASGQLVPSNHAAPALIEVSASGTLASGTRRVRVTLMLVQNQAADDINFTLSGPGGPPVINPGSIVSASAFGAFASVAPGSWIEIYGSFLDPSTLRNNCGGGITGSCWAGSDFNNGVAPTSLDGVSVSVNGQAAYIDYTSPTQVNALVPSNAGTGPSSIILTNANGMSEPFPIYIEQTEPGLLAPPGTFVINSKQYVAGILSDGSFALPTNAIPGVASRPANPGETVVFYGVGFGPTLPNFTAGTVVTGQNELATPIQFLFNTTPVTPAYWGLAPNYTGLYQFNVVVPNVGANNALPLSFTLGGVKGTQTLYIAVN